MDETTISLSVLTQAFFQRRAEPIFKLKRLAVLALITEKNGELCFVLNKRASGVHQPGDVCVPGGHHEKGETLLETALRETEEEMGIPKNTIQLLGRSDYMLTIYRGVIQPYLGFVPYDIIRASSPNPTEVAEIFTVPLTFFMQTEPEIHTLTWEAVESPTFPYERIEGGKTYPFSKCNIPELFYSYKGHTIWGLTAQIIQNIIEILMHALK